MLSVGPRALSRMDFGRYLEVEKPVGVVLAKPPHPLAVPGEFRLSNIELWRAQLGAEGTIER